MAIYSGFSHKQWWFSIAMLNYQRVNQPYFWANWAAEALASWQVSVWQFQAEHTGWRIWVQNLRHIFWLVSHPTKIWGNRPHEVFVAQFWCFFSGNRWWDQQCWNTVWWGLKIGYSPIYPLDDHQIWGGLPYFQIRPENVNLVVEKYPHKKSPLYPH